MDKNCLKYYGAFWAWSHVETIRQRDLKTRSGTFGGADKEDQQILGEFGSSAIILRLEARSGR